MFYICDDHYLWYMPSHQTRNVNFKIVNVEIGIFLNIYFIDIYFACLIQDDRSSWKIFPKILEYPSIMKFLKILIFPILCNFFSPLDIFWNRLSRFDNRVLLCNQVPTDEVFIHLWEIFLKDIIKFNVLWADSVDDTMLRWKSRIITLLDLELKVDLFLQQKPFHFFWAL